jgi:hypothetical protein
LPSPGLRHYSIKFAMGRGNLSLTPRRLTKSVDGAFLAAHFPQPIGGALRSLVDHHP